PPRRASRGPWPPGAAGCAPRQRAPPGEHPTTPLVGPQDVTLPTRELNGVKSGYPKIGNPDHPGAAMTITNTATRFTALPDDDTLAATIVALEEHGFSVEVVEDLDA